MEQKQWSDRDTVFAAIESERAYQNHKWANNSPDYNKKPSQWILYMEHYLSEARRLASTTSEDDFTQSKKEIMDAIRKVTALGVAAMESCGATFREIEVLPMGDLNDE